MFFYVSLVLVIVAAITLVIGLLSSGLPLVIVSIASSFFAGVFLVLTVLRDRPRADEEAKTPTVAPAVSRDEPDEDFPIAEYDDLKVGEIVPLLSELDDDELDVVRDREEGGRGRATILGRIDELLSEGEAEGTEAGELDQDAGFPIADYDELKVGEIVPLLPELDDDELDAVRDREVAGRARASIVGRIDELLGEAPAPAPAKKATAPVKTPSAAKSPAKTPSAAKSRAKKTAAKKTAAKKTAAKKTPAKKPAAAKKSAGTAKKSSASAKKSAPRARR